MSNAKPIVLTGAQPSAQLQLGNYLGAVRHWAAMQDDYECYCFLVDMHAITVKYKPADLRRYSLDCVALYIACGLDPKKSHLFLQSHVRGHAELAWILSCLCPVGELQRMTQFKDKSAKDSSFIGAGLLYYPLLMASDILLYNADAVPVGDDQKQHLELTRDMAQRFNQTYSDTFTIPEPKIPKHVGRIMSLQDPSKKMSKSDPNQNGTLFLLDSPDRLRKKIMSAVTDSGSEVKATADKPGVSNLLNILSGVTGKPIAALEKEFANCEGYAPFKAAVADAVVATLEPIQKRYEELHKDKDYLHQVLKDGAEAAQRRANRVLSKVYRKVGFLAQEG